MLCLKGERSQIQALKNDPYHWHHVFWHPAQKAPPEMSAVSQTFSISCLKVPSCVLFVHQRVNKSATDSESLGKMEISRDDPKQLTAFREGTM